jgi:hypothetical protein
MLEENLKNRKLWAQRGTKGSIGLKLRFHVYKAASIAYVQSHRLTAATKRARGCKFFKLTNNILKKISVTHSDRRLSTMYVVLSNDRLWPNPVRR